MPPVSMLFTALFSSSLHVYGRTHDQPPPRTIHDPVRPTEHYSRHKVECEELIRCSGLSWAILRFGAVLPLAVKLDPSMFDVPLANRMEFVHTRDVGLAMRRAARQAGWPARRAYHRAGLIRYRSG